MSPKNRQQLADRVTRAAEASLAAQGYVAPLDVLLGIGWLDADSEKRWRLGQIDSLEGVIQTNLSRISEAMELFRSCAETKGLLASEAEYVGRALHRPILRFSRSGDPTIERLYRTHWVSPALSERKRERLAEKASRPPDLVVIQPLNREWTCRRCGGTGDLLMMEPPGPACLRCVGLDDLSYATVEAVIAMNVGVCWSSGRLWPARSARSQVAKQRLPDASVRRRAGDDPASYA
jgi:hypothetical protein